ncbi:MAG: nucleoside triphosphate pyrophosphohydrolase [Candidatus Moranbacteria bacterium]|nr:nucleoside triphosphate pyrophosphohydrolase [Candidatus Moranbacteria bacterium]
MELQHFETNLAKEKIYPKLVRDNIPQIVGQKTGKEVKTRILADDQEYLEFLLKKVEEEAYELAHAEGREHLAEEAADILELLDSLLDLNGLTWEEITEIKRAKAEKNGGFKKRILMLEKV